MVVLLLLMMMMIFFGGRFCSKRHIGFGRSVGVVMAVAICFAVQKSELQLFDYRNYNSRSRGARF